MTAADRYREGLEVRRSVLGSEYVANALADAENPSALQRMVTEFGWGFVWARDELPRQTRSLLTIALLTALNRPHELLAHVRGAVRNGCTREQIEEAVLHCAAYCGLPAAIDAMRVVEQALAES